MTSSLWLDNDSKPFLVKAERAIQYFIESYHQVPKVIYVHPKSGVDEQQLQTTVMPNPIQIKFDSSLLTVGHFRLES